MMDDLSKFIGMPSCLNSQLITYIGVSVINRD